MTPVFNPRTDIYPEWHESFPKTNTLPDGWSLEELSLAVAPASPADTPPDWREPFPTPRTIPTGWDLPES